MTKLLATLVLVVGCGTTGVEGAQTVEPRGRLELALGGATEAQVNAAALAVSDWTEATGGYFSPTVNWAEGRELTGLIPGVRLVPAAELGGEPNVTLLDSAAPPVILVRDDLGPAELRVAVAHELGHALGLGAADRGLMCDAPVIGDGTALDSFTAGNYLALRGEPPVTVAGVPDARPCQ